MNEKYLEAEMDVVEFNCQDVIATSPFEVVPSLSPGEDQFL